jgi:hypothetical protein
VIALDDRFSVANDVHARQFDGEIVILHLRAGKYFGLNDVGALVWQSLLAGASVSDVIVRLRGEYDVDETTLSGDILTLVEQLLERNLVVKVT